MDTRRIVLKVSIVTIVVNLLLTAVKFTFGIMFDNLSVISDALHSGSDLFTSFLIILAVFLSSPKRDKKHNYGHEKVEPLATLFLSLILGAVAIYLAWQGIEGLISPSATELNWYLIGTVVISLVAKEWMFWYEMHYAKKYKSEILRADAWHSRSDSLSSIAVLIGLVASAFIHTNIVESIAVLVVSIMILKVAFDIMRPAINQLVDKAASEETYNKIKEIASGINGVESVDELRTRMFGNKIYVDIEIAVSGKLTVEQSHEIAQSVHDILEATESLQIKHCMVHVNPSAS